MRPIYECPENFWESLTMPTATFPEIFNAWAFLPIDDMNMQKKMKFVALPIPEISGVPKKLAVHGYAHAAFTKIV